MKLGFGRRVLMFLHWLLSLLICAAFAAYLIAPDAILDLYQRAEASVGATGMRIAGIALLAVYAALAVCQAILIFRRKKKADRGFIEVDSSDAGKVRISVAAVEQLVRQSVDSIDGITDMHIDIDSQDDAIGIVVNASIVSGSHVPTITMNMQRSIRQFVEMNCGVAVRTVSISINAVSAPQEAPRRRHLLARTAEPAPAAKTPVDIATPIPQPAEADAPQIPSERENAAGDDAPGFDPDKPYVSEFAKDLAAMKAAEQNADGDAAPDEGGQA